MIAHDALTLDAPKVTKDGYLAVRARAARSGLYDYAGIEVDPDNAHGLRDKAVVKVYRSGDQVFDRASIASFIGKPITNDHPATAVTADNWRDHARGTVMGAVRDGEYVSFDLMLTDAAAIKAVQSGKRELSNGYQTTLDFTPGTTPEGLAYDVAQTQIRGNHIALVDRGRAGPECRIADAAICDSLPRSFFDSLTTDGVADAKKWLKKAIALHKMHMNGSAPTTGADGEKSQMLMMKQMENALAELDGSTSSKPMKMDQLNTQEKPVKKIVLDGLQVDLSDADAVSAAFTKLQDKASAAETALADAQGKLSTVTGEKAALEAKLADAAKAAEPAALDKLVADRAALIGKAKAAKPDIVTDGKTDADIRKEIVVAKLGDAAAGLDDAAISGAFAVLSVDATTKVHNIGTPSNPTANTANIRDAARRFRNA